MSKDSFHGPLEQVDPCCWRIPKSYKPGMLVDGMIFANDKLIQHVIQDQAPEQVANVAFLPGIQTASIAMPDIHWGYGFCIGGVAATDPEQGGVISPGGVGYDINCGVRLVRSNLTYRDVKGRLRELIDTLFKHIPTGVGKSGKYHFDQKELQHLLGQGSRFLRSRGLATETDLEHTEAGGWLDGADPSLVSEEALRRGAEQCGTLGSGNHFLEVQIVDHVFDEEAANVMGLEKDMVCVMIHSGSRGLGYQVCDDALKALRKAPEKYGIALPDRQLACAPADSPEGRRYIAEMRAGANFAWCNRQLLMMQAREVFAKVFGRTWEELQMGFGTVLAKLQSIETPDEIQGIPDEPAPTEEVSKAPPVVRESAPIVIPDDEPAALVEQPKTAPADLAVTVGATIEWPAAPVCGGAPLVMPACHDEELCEVLPKPTVETEEVEILPMPEVETEEEPTNGVETDEPLGWFGALISGEEKVSVPTQDESYQNVTEQSQADECREDPHRHHHYSGCPYTGRCYPMPASGCPGGKSSCEPPKRDGVEEESEEQSETTIAPAVLKKLRRFKTREAVDDGCPTHPSIDTMEFRPSDRNLHDYGRGSGPL